MTSPASTFSESIAGGVLERAFARGRLAHGLLLHSADTEMLESFARQLAALLLGTKPEWPASTSGHPDYLTLRPSGKSRQIRVGEDSGEPNTMRHFIRQLAQSPAAGSRKVGVVFEAERMNANASNSFLKTLEEPPLNTTIILLTTRPYSLLATIRSRTLHFRLPASNQLSSDPELTAWLDDYRTWLGGLATGNAGDKTAVTRQVMTVYGLVSRFSLWIDNASAQALELLKAGGNLENLDDDEIDAIKTSTAVGVRQKFLAAVEVATCAFARKSTIGSIAAPATVRELERAAGLLRVNFNENNALELFLLAALRAWSRRD